MRTSDRYAIDILRNVRAEIDHLIDSHEGKGDRLDVYRDQIQEVRSQLDLYMTVVHVGLGTGI